MPPSDRVVERARGCYSCKHFENGALARRTWRRDHRPALEQHINEKAGLPPVSLDGAALDQQVADSLAPAKDMIRKMDLAVTNGVFGICMKGKRPADLGGPAGDFVHAAFLCDRWNGRDGASVATQGKKLDKLPAELRDDMEHKAKKRS